MKHLMFAGLVVALGILTGCSSMHVEVDHAPDFDFSALKTFAMVPPPTKAPAEMPGYSPMTAKRVQEAIAADLEAKGFRRVENKEEADFLVGFSVDGQHRTDVFSVGGGYGYGYWGGGTGSVVTQHYVQGTLVIDVADRKTGQIVWHGWGTKPLFPSEAGSGDPGPAVQEILKGFPPAPAKK